MPLVKQHFTEPNYNFRFEDHTKRTGRPPEDRRHRTWLLCSMSIS